MNYASSAAPVSVKQLHVGHHVILILIRQQYRTPHAFEKSLIMIGHFFECLCGVVVEVRNGMADSPQCWDLEGFPMLEVSRVRPSGNQGTAWIRTRHDRRGSVGVREYEIAHAI